MNGLHEAPATQPPLPERPGPEDLEPESRSVGHLVADVVTREIGSWRFIIVQGAILASWLVVNVVAWAGS